MNKNLVPLSVARRAAGLRVFFTTAAVTLLPLAAHAEGEFTITPPAFDMILLGTMATNILTGLAAIWLLRKAIKLTNKS